MADRLLEDPNLARVPDYASPRFQAVREVLVQGGRTIDEAIQLLEDAWQAENQHLRQVWAGQQERQDQPEPNHPPPPHAPDDAHADEHVQNPPPRQHSPPPPDQPPAPPTPSKHKVNPLAQGLLITSARKPQPAPFALRKLEKLEYVPLWYFTEEGCEDALRFDHTASQDTFALTKVKDTVSLRPVNVARASKLSLPDEKLTWRQMDIAKTLMLHHMGDFNSWPPEYAQMLGAFFFALEMHPRRRQPRGEKVLLQYQAEARAEWTRLLTQEGVTEVFDISIINEERLRLIDDEIFGRQREELLIQVSPPPLPFPLLSHLCNSR